MSQRDDTPTPTPSPTPPSPQPEAPASGSRRRRGRNAGPLPLSPAVVTGVERQGRGVTASIAGLIVSLAVAAALLVAGAAVGFPGAVLPGFLLAVGAAAVWVGTLVTYLFRKQAAVEDVELEELQRSGEAQRSIFADATDARPAVRRVRRAYRYVLPIAAAVAGLAMVVPGALTVLRSVRQFETLSIPANSAAAAAVLGLLAFITFVAGRWLIGLARQDHLRLLRGGASLLIGAAGLMLVGAVGFGVADFGEGEGRILIGVQVAAAVGGAVAALLGLEFLVNLLLDLYRPRKPGEEPRPAADSRLLGAFAAPGGAVASLNEAINYQFGFDVTGGVLYRVVTRSLAWLAVGGVVALLALSSVFTVEPHQQAIVTTFGDAADPAGPGLHFKAPWPIGQVEHYDVARLRTLRIGSHEDRVDAAPGTLAPLLYSNEHSQDEELFVLAPPPSLRNAPQAEVDPDAGNPDAENPDAELAEPAPSVSLASAEVIVTYRVGDLKRYLLANGSGSDADDDELLDQLATEVAHRQMQRVTLDELMGPGRLGVADAIEADLTQAVAAMDLGLVIEDVGVAGVHYDTQLDDAFNQAETAPTIADAVEAVAELEATQTLTAAAGEASDARRIVAAIDAFEASQRTGTPEEVEAAANRVADLIARAEGRAAEVLTDARAYQLARVFREEGRLAEFQGQQAAFDAAPRLQRARRALAEFAEVMPRTRVLLLAADPDRVDVRYDSAAETGGGLDLIPN